MLCAASEEERKSFTIIEVEILCKIPCSINSPMKILELETQLGSWNIVHGSRGRLIYTFDQGSRIYDSDINFKNQKSKYSTELQLSELSSSTSVTCA